MHIIRGEKNSNIESIEFLDEEIEMCEITIDSDEHSYYLNGVLTHNCAEELRLAAGLSKEPVLYNAFKTGQDPHKMTAIKMFGEDNYNKDRRKDAKISNFGLLYDGNEYTLASATGKDIEECRILYKQYWKTMSTLKMWKRQQVTKCYQNGGVCYTAYGRPRRLLYYLNHPLDKMRSFGERSVCSHIIQGCLQSHVRVLTDKGLIPIGELFFTDYSNMKVWTGKRWAHFTVHNRGKAELAKMHFRRRPPLDCDTRHKVRVHNMHKGSSYRDVTSLCYGSRVCANKIMEVDFPEVLPNFYKSIPRRENSGEFYIKSSQYSEFFYWLGRYFGDGCFVQRKDKIGGDFSIYFGRHEEKDADRFIEFFSSLCNTKIAKRFKENEKGGKSIEVVICNAGLSDFLIEEVGISLGKTAKTKRVPEKLFRSPLEYRKQFINGLFDSDGSKNQDAIHLKNQDLLNDVRQICEVSGIFCSLSKVYSDGSSVLRMSGGRIIKNVRGEPKQKSLDDFYSSRTFTKLEPLGTYEDTYTLSVQDEDPQFVADGIIQKNTGGDIMRMTLIKLYKSLFIPYAKDSGFIGCVHDEIVFWVNKDIIFDVVHQVQDIMEVTVPTSDIKLETSVEVGNSYGYTFPFKWENGILVPKVA